MSGLRVVHDRYGTLVVNESGHVVNRCDTPAEAHRYVQEVMERRRIVDRAFRKSQDKGRRAVESAVVELIERHRDEYEALRRGFLDTAC